MGPGAPEKLGAPVLLQTLALYSYMTFENAKFAQIGKKIQIEMTAKEFLVQKQMRTKSKITSP